MRQNRNRMKRDKKYTFLKIFTLILAVAFGGLVFFSVQEEKRESAELAEMARESAKEAKDELDAEAESRKEEIEEENAKILAEQQNIRESAKQVGFDESQGELLSDVVVDQTVENDSFQINIPEISNTGLILIKCKALERSTQVTTTVEGCEMKYDVSTQSSRLYIPIDEISLLELSVENSLFIESYQIYQFSDNDNILDVKSGLWIDEDTYIQTELSLGTGITNEKSYACISDNEYLYVAHADYLGIYDVKSGNLVNLMDDVITGRHMQFAADGDVLVVTARSNGVYLIDISNPDEASILSHIDSLELATGLFVQGDYLFVCSRYFGAEIWDISNPSSPEFCSNVRGGTEYQNCYVDGTTLYIAVFNDCRIIAYDVQNPYSPQYIGEFMPEGKPYAIVVEDGILYTSIAVSDLSHNSNTDLAYGLQNGFAIYNISDINNPTKISSAKLDGRFDTGAFDIYGLQIQDNKLYLSHTYNGLYIYDISDKENPVLLENIRIPIYSYDEEEFRVNSGSNIWPFNRDVYMPDPVLDFTFSDNCIYLAGAYTGVYCVSEEDVYCNTVYTSNSFSPDTTSKDNDSLVVGGFIVEQFKGYDVRAVSVLDQNYYLACGNDGVIITDLNFEIIKKIDVPGIVRDINVLENSDSTAQIYAASDNGLYIYSVNNQAVELIVSQECNINDLQVSADGTMILAAGDNAYLFEVSKIDGEYIIEELYKDTFGGLYYRHLISGLVSNRYAAIQTGSDVKWWDLETKTGTPLSINVNTLLGEGAGYAALGDQCLAMYKGGYVLYNLESEEISFDELEVIFISGEQLRGHPVILNDNTLVVSRGNNGDVWIIDITDVEQPQLITKFNTVGNPDIAATDGTSILIPLRHEGLIKLTRK